MTTFTHVRLHAGRFWRRLLAGPALAAILFATAVTLMAPAPAAYALDRQTGNDIVVPAGQTVDDDWAAAGRFVRVDGTIRGDAYVLANTVRVTGTIEGDLIAAAQQVIIDGTVQGSVRAAGAVVEMNGAVGRNVTGLAQLLQVGSGGRVAGNVVGAGETVTIDGDIGGGLASAGRDVNLQGRVARGAEMSLTSLTLGPRARIGGDLTYYAAEAQNVSAQAVGGQVHWQRISPTQQQRLAARPRRMPSQALHAIGNFFSLAWLVGSAVAGLLMLRLFPRFVAEFLGVLERRPLPSLGMGVLVLIATLPAAVLLALTIVGMPLAALVATGYFAGIFAGWLLLAVAVGSILVGMVRGGRPWHHGWSFLLGLLVLYVVTHIPVLGGLLGFAGAALGVGALVLAIHRTWQGNAVDALATPSPAI